MYHTHQKTYRPSSTKVHLHSSTNVSPPVNKRITTCQTYYHLSTNVSRSSTKVLLPIHERITTHPHTYHHLSTNVLPLINKCITTHQQTYHHSSTNVSSLIHKCITTHPQTCHHSSTNVSYHHSSRNVSPLINKCIITFFNKKCGDTPHLSASSPRTLSDFKIGQTEKEDEKDEKSQTECMSGPAHARDCRLYPTSLTLESSPLSQTAIFPK